MRALFVLFTLFFSVGALAQNSYSPCNKAKIYIFDHPQLKKKVDKPMYAKVSPMWEGKQDSLSQFFGKYVSYTAPKESPIQRIILTFTVDCNGNPGDFRFENKERWPIEEHIMKACKEEMLKWIPATDKKGNTIDCRQVIIFSIANTKMKVMYRESD